MSFTKDFQRTEKGREILQRLENDRIESQFVKLRELRDRKC